MTTPSVPRILAIMGSGETAPTMNAPHRAIFERLGTDVDAVLLDTPFGFQENAPILASKAIEYFRDAVGRRVEAAGLTRTDSGDTVAVERGVAKVRSADWVFAGPGSPTFALEQWRNTPVPGAIADKLRSMVRKWQTLIEAHVDVKTTDGFTLRMFCIGFTKKRQGLY